MITNENGRRTQEGIIQMLTERNRNEDATPSRKAAIEAMCVSCIYDESDKGSWRSQCEACSSTSCPLWKLRPVTSKRKTA